MSPESGNARAIERLEHCAARDVLELLCRSKSVGFERAKSLILDAHFRRAKSVDAYHSHTKSDAACSLKSVKAKRVASRGHEFARRAEED